MKTNNFILLLVLLTLALSSCKTDTQALPKLGKKKFVDGVEVPHTIPSWTYLRHDSTTVTDQDLKDYIYVADFFFTSCPTICPRVAKEMLRIQEALKDEPMVRLVSFTIDPERDTPSVLKRYADNIGADTQKWWFLTGEKEPTYELANEYFVVAYEDASVPGGFDHSGKIILVDKEGHIRSFSEGTDPSETPKIIADAQKLLKEYAVEQ